jgi:hypothetical protein
MIAAAPRQDLVDQLESELNALAIGQFSSDEFNLYFGTPLTLERARFNAIQMVFYNNNRREGWAFVQARAPWVVKQAIWHHEEDELFHDPRAGSDHRVLMSTEAIALGATAEEVANAQPTPLIEAVFSGWNHMNASDPWLAALTGSHFLERRNNSNIIPGGAMSKRWRDKLVRELGVAQDSLKSSNVHIVADVDHSDAIWDAVTGGICSDYDFQTALDGARKAARLDRAFRGALAHEMRVR